MTRWKRWKMIDEVERARNEANDLFLQLVREATKKGYHVFLLS